MKAANALLATAVAGVGLGCGLIQRSPLRPENQMPPPPPITYSRYHQDGWRWEAVARVVVFSPRNESEYTNAGEEFQQALALELQRAGRFEVVAAPFDDNAKLASLMHQGGRFDEGTALAICRETRADVLIYPSVTQYSPYPRPRLGVVIQAVSPADGKVVASVDGVWDTTDGGIAEQLRAYYRQRPKPLPTYVRNHTIVADDNYAADIALDSPALFQRYVAHVVTRLLIGGDESPGGSKGAGKGAGAVCCPAPAPPLLRKR